MVTAQADRGHGPEVGELGEVFVLARPPEAVGKKDEENQARQGTDKQRAADLHQHLYCCSIHLDSSCRKCEASMPFLGGKVKSGASR